MVLKQEVSAIDAKCAQMYPRKNQKPPDLLVIICGKRHRTRFYPTNAEHADQTRDQNTRSGVSNFRSTHDSRLYMLIFSRPLSIVASLQKNSGTFSSNRTRPSRAL